MEHLPRIDRGLGFTGWKGIGLIGAIVAIIAIIVIFGSGIAKGATAPFLDGQPPDDSSWMVHTTGLNNSCYDLAPAPNSASTAADLVELADLRRSTLSLSGVGHRSGFANSLDLAKGGLSVRASLRGSLDLDSFTKLAKLRDGDALLAFDRQVDLDPRDS